MLILPSRCIIDDTVTTRSVTFGSSRLVSAKWPRWLVPIWLSNPSLVCAYGTAMMPALLTRTSTLSTPSANARTDARSCRSSWRISTSPVIPDAAASPLAVLRTASTTLAPTRASSRAVTSPRPLLAPVTMTVRPANEGRSAAVHSLMGQSLMTGQGLLGLDHESPQDGLDVGSVRGGLVGEARDRELDQVLLPRHVRARRRAGGDHDAVVTLHALAVEVVGALDHRRREAAVVVS